MVRLLLEAGAAKEITTRDGLTPLHCAARSGHDQVVDVLIEGEEGERERERVKERK